MKQKAFWIISLVIRLHSCNGGPNHNLYMAYIRHSENKNVMQLTMSKSEVEAAVQEIISAGFVQLRENLEKGLLGKNQGNLENSGNSLTVFTTSGKTQGILFCQTSLFK